MDPLEKRKSEGNRHTREFVFNRLPPRDPWNPRYSSYFLQNNSAGIVPFPSAAGSKRISQWFIVVSGNQSMHVTFGHSGHAGSRFVENTEQARKRSRARRSARAVSAMATSNRRARSDTPDRRSHSRAAFLQTWLSPSVKLRSTERMAHASSSVITHRREAGE